MLKVLVGGYPNSGTSFLCNLISEIGLNTGFKKDLKQADSHNRYGYFENIKIRNETWKILEEKRFTPWADDFLSKNPLKIEKNQVSEIMTNIDNIIQKDNVQLYKDNAVPLIYKLFKTNVRIIIIERFPRNIYDSPRKAKRDKMPVPYDKFLESYERYKILAQKMSEEREVLFVQYEAFAHNFDREVIRMLKFLDIHSSKKVEQLQSLYKPRELNDSNLSVETFIKKLLRFFFRKK